ncbi:MAG: DUF2062 domain-containing protein [Acidobacteria bacterium]|jgi:hypothetical protein|nr:DUF2062 domain-containing protein [Acidobacteriota bacterium]
MKRKVLEMVRLVSGLGDSAARTGVAAGVGVFIGLLPIAPFQTLVAIAAAFALRLNRVAVFAGTLIWQPFTAPFILGAELAAGKLILPSSSLDPTWKARWLVPIAAGAAVLAAVGGLLAGVAVFWAKSWFDRRKTLSPVSKDEGLL